MNNLDDNLHFAECDFETNNLYNVKVLGYPIIYAIGLYSEKIGQKRFLTVWDFLKYIRESDINLIYFHNGGMFDLHYLDGDLIDLKIVPSHSYNNQIHIGYFQHFTTTTSKQIYLKIFFMGKIIMFKDSFNYARSSVEVIAKNNGIIQEEKGKLDYSMARKYNNVKEIPTDLDKYLANDLIAPYRVINEFHQMYSKKQMKSTIGSLAFNDLKNSVGKFWKNHIAILTEDENDYFRQWYGGGDVGINPKHAHKMLDLEYIKANIPNWESFTDTDLPFQKYDRNSCYTKALTEPREYGLPSEKPWRDSKGKVLANQGVLIHAEFFNIVLKPKKFPYLKYKHKSDFDRVYKDNYFEFYGTQEEFELVKDKYDIKEIKIKKKWFFKRKKWCADWTLDKYAKRLEFSKDPIKKQIYKDLPNNVYGKFAERLHKEVKDFVLVTPENEHQLRKNSRVFDCPTGERFWLKRIKKDESIYKEKIKKEVPYIICGIFIPATMRVDLHRVLDFNFDKVLCWDTDGINCIGKLEMPKGLKIHQTELGAFKIEDKYCGKYFYMNNRKSYGVSNDLNDKALITVAGLKKDVREYMKLESMMLHKIEQGKNLIEVYRGRPFINTIDFTFDEKFKDLNMRELEYWESLGYNE